MLDNPGIESQAHHQGFHAGFYDFGKACVPGVAYFNCALLERQDGNWLLARRSRNWGQFLYGYNDLMAFKLENNKPVFGMPVNLPPKVHLEHFEDPRPFWWKGHLLVSCCNFVVFAEGRQWTGAHQALFPVDDKWNAFQRFDPVHGMNGGSVMQQRGNEKNWIWFEHNGEPHLIYLTTPHRIVRFSSMFAPLQQWETPGVIWEWGTARGGTPPVRIHDEYWSFFHSSLPWRGKFRRYFMGAYAFSAEPPFEVTRFTSRPLLSGSQQDPWQENKPLVVFPCGALFKDGNWLVSMGINDLASAWFRIPHHRLEDRTLPPPA